MVTGIGTVVMQQQLNAAASMMNSGSSPVSAEPVKRASDNRRSNKPIMEKRRRARINNCLNELKTLILDATKKDPARHSKLEKADILEKTVKYLQDLQRQQSAMTQAADPSIVNKFKAGFTECAKEVDRFQGLEPVVKRRLLQHLSNYLNGVKSDHQQQLAQQLHAQQQLAAQLQPSQLQQVQIHMLPSSPPGSPEQSQQSAHVNGVHPQQQQNQQQQQILKLTPTNGYYLTLPNGILTYVAPAQMSQPQHHQQLQPNAALPQLVPIPSRTSSTVSAASSSLASTTYERLSARDTSCSSPISYAPPSPANSYEAMEYTETTTTNQLPGQYRQSPPPLQLRPSSQSSDTVDDVDDEDIRDDDENDDDDDDDDEDNVVGNNQDDSGFDIDVDVQRSCDSPVPLSLVMKKNHLADKMVDDEDRPWRPW